MQSRSVRTASFYAGVFAALSLVAGCGGGPDDTCVANAECRSGEYCDPISAKCACGTPDDTSIAGGSADASACAVADAANTCHPTTKRCVPACADDADCSSTEECSAAKVCVPKSGGDDDCTVAGQECASDKVCDPATKRCIAECSASSCTAGDVCDPNSRLCIAECTANSCGTGLTCDTTTKLCVAACGEGTCSIDQYCGDDGRCANRCDTVTAPTLCNTATEYCDADTGTGKCLPKCDQPGAACDDTTEVCGGDGLCIGRCPAFLDCGAGFCNQSTGFCEDAGDITQCNPEGVAPTARQYLNESTNLCESTAELAANCPNAANRDTGNAEVADGPTLYSATQFNRVANSANCTNGPEISVLVEYYDPTGGMFGATASTEKVANAALRQAVSGSDASAFSSSAVVTCINGTETGCQGKMQSSDKRGSFVITLCRPVSAPATEKLAIYAADRADNWGNTICFDSANQ